MHFIFAKPPEDPLLCETLQTVVMLAALNPDPGSDFDIATRDIRHLPGTAFLAELKSLKYECIVAEQDGEFMGLVGYQMHIDETWHSFAYHVQKAHEGKGVGKALARAFLDAGFKAGIRYMRFYGGDARKQLDTKNAETMTHLYENVILGNELGLSFLCERGHDVGWITLKERSAVSA